MFSLQRVSLLHLAQPCPLSACCKATWHCFLAGTAKWLITARTLPGKRSSEMLYKKQIVTDLCFSSGYLLRYCFVLVIIKRKVSSTREMSDVGPKKASFVVTLYLKMSPEYHVVLISHFCFVSLTLTLALSVCMSGKYLYHLPWDWESVEVKPLVDIGM